MKRKTNQLFCLLLIIVTISLIVCSCKKDDPIVKKDVVITWANPADIVAGTPLSATQLNATASVPGNFVYTPAIGTVLNAGNAQSLKVDFTPIDFENYNPSSKTVTINVTTTFTDTRDGNVYKTVIIGNQIWMAENLRASKYSNGDIIGTTVPASLDIVAESNPKYEWVFDNNAGNIIPYGRLYTWYAVTDSRNVCPTSWHVSTDEEWTTLVDLLGGEAIAGGKLKEIGTDHWNAPNTGATNITNFTAVPGGVRNVAGLHDYKEQIGFWWSATEYNAQNAWGRQIKHDTGNVYRIDNNKKIGFSVRCVKDK